MGGRSCQAGVTWPPRMVLVRRSLSKPWASAWRTFLSLKGGPVWFIHRSHGTIDGVEHEGQVRQLLHDVHVLVDEAHARVDVARLELVQERVGVGHDLVDDPVEVGLARLPVARVLHEHEVAAGHPLLEHERPGADGRPKPLVRLDLGAAQLAQDVPGQDAERGHRSRKGASMAENWKITVVSSGVSTRAILFQPTRRARRRRD